MRLARLLGAALEELAGDQAGLVSRAQLTGLGIPRSYLRSQLHAARWRQLCPGVIATFTGPPSDLARVWAGLLYAGRGAVASGDAAAWLWGLRPDLPATVTVGVPHGERPHASRPGIRVLQSRQLATRTHPSRRPPRTTVEDTVLDRVNTAHNERQVIDLVLTACQRRHTTPAKLGRAAAARGRLRWRRLVQELLGEVAAGVESPLERCYLRDVERRHGLPRGQRNRPEGPAGARRYRDVRYLRWGLVVELDGRAAHPSERHEFDDLRDNEVATRDERTLRYGWRSVTGSPCAVADQVASMLARAGWRGQPRACGPGCRRSTRTDDDLAAG